eukprot:scaffold24053_cov55-Phaeocystis_antarctica.AAC.4
MSRPPSFKGVNLLSAQEQRRPPLDEYQRRSSADSKGSDLELNFSDPPLTPPPPLPPPPPTTTLRAQGSSLSLESSSDSARHEEEPAPELELALGAWEEQPPPPPKPPLPPAPLQPPPPLPLPPPPPPPLPPPPPPPPSPPQVRQLRADFESRRADVWADAADAADASATAQTAAAAEHTPEDPTAPEACAEQMAVASELLELMAEWAGQVQHMRTHFEGLRGGLYAAEAASPSEAFDTGCEQLPLGHLARAFASEHRSSKAVLKRSQNVARTALAGAILYDE